MGKDKLRRFGEVDKFENVFEFTDFSEKPKPKGRWHKDIFKNDNPIILELACGKGEYTLNLARQFPVKNFIGIDIKGARIWRGAKTALQDQLDNVRFVRMYIDHLDEYFEKDEIDEIWITFPDPYPRKSKRSKRLTSPKFQNIYNSLLKKDGVIHLKTDSDFLYNYTLKTISEERCRLYENIDDVYKEKPNDPLLTIKTFYEQMHLKKGKTIHYLSFRLA